MNVRFNSQYVSHVVYSFNTRMTMTDVMDDCSMNEDELFRMTARHQRCQLDDKRDSMDVCLHVHITSTCWLTSNGSYAFMHRQPRQDPRVCCSIMIERITHCLLYTYIHRYVSYVIRYRCNEIDNDCHSVDASIHTLVIR
jgi:hypothetical protein